MGMVTKLIHGVFKKAKKDSEKDGATALSRYIHHTLLDLHNINVSERSLLRYYNSYINSSEKKPSIQEETRDGLAIYLGFSSYSKYVAENFERNEKAKQNNVFQFGDNPININTFNGNIEIN